MKASRPGLIVLAWLATSTAASSQDGSPHAGHPEGVLFARTSLEGAPFGLAVSATGVVLVTLARSGVVARAQLPDTAFSVTIPIGQIPTGVAINATGSRAYVTNQGSASVSAIELATNQILNTIPVTGRAPGVVAVTPGDRGLYVTTTADEAYFINLATRTIDDRLLVTVDGPPNGLAFSPDGSQLYVSTVTGSVFECDRATARIERRLYVGGRPQGIAVSPDGTELYVANETTDSSGGLDIWSLTTGRPIARVAIGGRGFALAVTPDGAEIYVTQSLAGRVQIVDRATLRPKQAVETGGRPRRIAFDRQGTTAVIANEEGWVDFIR